MAERSGRRDIKKGIDASETKKNRAETTLQIRKDKKEDQLSKRRFASGFDEASGSFPSSSSGGMGGQNNLVSPSQTTAISPQFIAQCKANIYSNDPAVVIKATQQFRRILSIEKNPPIQPVIDSGVIPRLVEFLQLHDNAPLQFEAAWALTNIASGTSEHTRVVMDAGAVPIFIQLLSSANEDVREQAAWALGNISGDSVLCRDTVLSMNALPALTNVFADQARLSTIRNATWTLSNLCRGKPAPPFETVRPAIPLVARLIFNQDIETITDACWALSYLSDGPNERIQAVLEAGVAPRLVELLASPHSAVQTPALRTVGNIVTGDDKQTQFIVNLNAIPALCWLLDHTKKNIRKEACWTLSNITAGTHDQIQQVIAAGVFPKLIELLRSGEFDIQKEAAWAISNATSGGTPEQILYLAAQGTIPPLCHLLVAPDNRVLTVALEGLENILRAGKVTGQNVLDQLIESFHECEGISAIEDLQNHESRGIYERAVRILEEYFEAEEDAESSEITPGVVGSGQGGPGQQFAFGSGVGDQTQGGNTGGFRF